MDKQNLKCVLKIKIKNRPDLRDRIKTKKIINEIREGLRIKSKKRDKKQHGHRDKEDLGGAIKTKIMNKQDLRDVIKTKAANIYYIKINKEQIKNLRVQNQIRSLRNYPLPCFSIVIFRNYYYYYYYLFTFKVKFVLFVVVAVN